MGSIRSQLQETLDSGVPHLVESIGKHGHLDLDSEVKGQLPAVNAATLGRLLRPVNAA